MLNLLLCIMISPKYVFWVYNKNNTHKHYRKKKLYKLKHGPMNVRFAPSVFFLATKNVNKNNNNGSMYIFLILLTKTKQTDINMFPNAIIRSQNVRNLLSFKLSIWIGWKLYGEMNWWAQLNTARVDHFSGDPREWFVVILIQFYTFVLYSWGFVILGVRISKDLFWI